MPAVETFWLVAAATLVLWLLPGPALLLLLTRGLDLGPRGAVATAVGLGIGTSVHVLAAALGLSALLATSAAAFTVVKVLGGCYLLWLGIQRWRDPTPLVPVDDRPTAVASWPRALREGATINALNPKVAAFYLAFLPPFLDPERGSVLVQTLLLGLLSVLVLLAGDALFGFAAGHLGRGWLRRVVTPQRDARARHAVGAVYVGLGAWALASGNRPPAPAG